MTTKPSTDVVDIDAFLPDELFELAILKPGTTEPTGWVLQLAPPGHDKAVAYSTSSSKARLKKEALEHAQQVNGRKVKPDERSVDEQKLDNVNWVASRLLGWSTVKSALFGPDPIPFSDDNVRMVFMHPKMGWAYAQVVDHLTEEGNFTKRSASISSTTPSAPSS